MKGTIGVYILQCRNGRYYTGSTDNLARRFDEHLHAKVKSTKHLLPVQLKAFLPCNTLQEARQLEYHIKRQKKKKLIEEIIFEYPIQE